MRATRPQKIFFNMTVWIPRPFPPCQQPAHENKKEKIPVNLFLYMTSNLGKSWDTVGISHPTVSQDFNV
ncbi:MAG: hypothetical protein A3I75_07820 [Deltaproteobacteria bacterium RIFCSPLOWO2_02_FULL_50_16]|nr:MAG: hypothetical protein A3I75_07820 [Deltaproteobacteria bacterium RIFCSPLOWO2_02_FULL_50_16]OGQ65405.1 MAG: hypothetical protein A3F89_08505 [Deltaproteobacteria bacterium RIFCSPLOWO2_12_FULL_50_11]